MVYNLFMVVDGLQYRQEFEKWQMEIYIYMNPIVRILLTINSHCCTDFGDIQIWDRLLSSNWHSNTFLSALRNICQLEFKDLELIGKS